MDEKDVNTCMTLLFNKKGINFNGFTVHKHFAFSV